LLQEAKAPLVKILQMIAIT